MKRVYLDTAASTPLDKRVRKVFVKALGLHNPSSIHAEGVAAAAVLGAARSKVAELFTAHSDEITFTSGGTESNNLALLGVARALAREQGKPGHIITSVIEHSSAINTCKALERDGYRVTYLPVSPEGLVDERALKEALTPETVLVSIMYANNEMGVVQPITALRKVVQHYRKEQGRAWPYFHTDACQATRFYSLAVPQLGVDLMTINGAKMYGPKGSAVLYHKRGVKLEPLVYGGEQENGVRSGTEFVAGAAALAAALELCTKLREKESAKLVTLRDYFIKKLLESLPGTELNGSLVSRLPNNVSLYFPDVLAEQAVIELDIRGIACSTGSACSFNTKDDSYVIMALGKSREVAERSIRFSLGRDVTKRQLDYTVRMLKALRVKMSGLIA